VLRGQRVEDEIKTPGVFLEGLLVAGGDEIVRTEAQRIAVLSRRMAENGNACGPLPNNGLLNIGSTWMSDAHLFVRHWRVERGGMAAFT
jgi:hypothetical protein